MHFTLETQRSRSERRSRKGAELAKNKRHGRIGERSSRVSGGGADVSRLDSHRARADGIWVRGCAIRVVPARVEHECAESVAQTPHFSVWIGTALVLIGVAVNLLAALHHVRLVRELNRGITSFDRPSRLAISVAMVLAVVGVAMAVYLAFVR